MRLAVLMITLSLGSWIAWGLYLLGRGVLAFLWRRLPQSETRPYGRANPQAVALALAHPMFVAKGLLPCMVRPGAAAVQDVTDASLPAGLAGLRPVLLQYFGLRASSSETEIRQGVENLLRYQWYRMDMTQLGPQDDLRDGVAFAVARVAFATRAAALLGWLPVMLHEQVMQLNAQRAAACFSSWEEYGWAYARGRQQWIVRSRPDLLGAGLHEGELERWLTSRLHPWCRFSWPTSH